MLRALTSALALLVGLTLAPAGPSPYADASPPDRSVRAERTGVPVRTIDPLRLRRGPDAAIDHLQDGVIHSASGHSVRVRIPYGLDQLALLGRSSDSWLVAWGTALTRSGYHYGVSRVRSGRPPVPVRKQAVTTYGEDFHGWLLDRDGRTLVDTTFDRGGSSIVVRDVATGRATGSRYSGYFATPYDASGGHVAVFSETESGGTRVVDWLPPGTETPIAKRAAYVSLERDLVFARTAGRDYGPTSTSAPATPAWAAPFAPLDISPDGASAVG